MNIRTVRLKAAEGIATAHVKSWRSVYRGIITDDFLANLSIERGTARWQETLGNQGSRHRVFVAEDDQQCIVGFVSGGPQRDANLPAYDGKLYAIYLLAGNQRQGIGRGLSKALAGQLSREGFAAMLVWVLADNPFRKFYEALGGQIVTEKPITIGKQELVEVAYGWPDLRLLVEA